MIFLTSVGAASGGEMLAQKGKDLGPAVGRLFGAITCAHGVEEGVAGAVIAVELTGFAEALEHGLGAIDLILVGVLVVIAEQT